MTGARWIAVTVLLLAVTGCGLPDSQTSEPVPAAEVPYGLLGDNRPAPASGPQSTPPGAPHVYWLRDDGRLQAVAAEADSGSPDTVAGLFGLLAAGPDESLQAAGLGTALGTDVSLELVDLSGKTAVVQVTFNAQEPSPDRLPAAIGQLVLTAVSSPSVTAVQIVQDGEVVSVPLPSGALSREPLTEADYASLVAPL